MKKRFLDNILIGKGCLCRVKKQIEKKTSKKQRLSHYFKAVFLALGAFFPGDLPADHISSIQTYSPTTTWKSVSKSRRFLYSPDFNSPKNYEEKRQSPAQAASFLEHISMLWEEKSLNDFSIWGQKFDFPIDNRGDWNKRPSFYVIDGILEDSKARMEYAEMEKIYIGYYENYKKSKNPRLSYEYQDMCFFSTIPLLNYAAHKKHIKLVEAKLAQQEKGVDCPSSYEALHRSNHPAVVKIFKYNNIIKQTFIGSGFFIAPDILFTAFHVVNTPFEGEIEDSLFVQMPTVSRTSFISPSDTKARIFSARDVAMSHKKCFISSDVEESFPEIQNRFVPVKEIIAFSPLYDTALLRVAEPSEHFYSLEKKYKGSSGNLQMAGFPSGYFSAVKAQWAGPSPIPYYEIAEVSVIDNNLYSLSNLEGASGSPFVFEDGSVAGAFIRVVPIIKKRFLGFVAAEHIQELLLEEPVSCKSFQCIKEGVKAFVQQDPQDDKFKQYRIADFHEMKDTDYFKRLALYEQAADQGVDLAEMAMCRELHKNGCRAFRGKPDEEILKLEKEERKKRVKWCKRAAKNGYESAKLALLIAEVDRRSGFVIESGDPRFVRDKVIIRPQPSDWDIVKKSNIKIISLRSGDILNLQAKENMNCKPLPSYSLSSRFLGSRQVMYSCSPKSPADSQKQFRHYGGVQWLQKFGDQKLRDMLFLKNQGLNYKGSGY